MLDKTYFENTYIQNENDLVYDNPDAIACITIDGYASKDDDDDEGEVIAELYLTKHGDIIISWHDNAYSLNEHVLALIDESKMLLKNLFTENKPNGIITDADIAAIRIMITKCNNILKNASKS